MGLFLNDNGFSHESVNVRFGFEDIALNPLKPGRW